MMAHFIEEMKRHVLDQIVDMQPNYEILINYLDSTQNQYHRFEEEYKIYIENLEIFHNQTHMKAMGEHMKTIVYMILTFILMTSILPFTLLLGSLQSLGDFIRTLIIYIEITIFENHFKSSILMNTLILGLLIYEYFIRKLEYFCFQYTFEYLPLKHLLNKGLSKLMNVFNIGVPFA